MNPRTESARRWICPGIFLAVAAVLWARMPLMRDDSAWYVMLAEGLSEQVPLPFAARRLAPAAAGALAAGPFGLDVAAAFRLLGLAAAAVLVLSLSRIGRRLPHAPPWCAAILLTPLFGDLVSACCMPDLYLAAAAGLFFAAVSLRPTAGLVAVLPAVMICEHSALLLGAAAWVLRREGRTRTAAVLAAAAVARVAGAATFAPAGAGNVHALAGPVYLLLKIPFNLIRNLLGIELWIDTIDYIAEPVRTWTLPGRLSIGSVREIGFCGWRPDRPLWLLGHLLTMYGLLPGAWLWLRRRAPAATTALPTHLRMALAYGTAALVMAPALGAATDRLVGLAWPAFWIAVPAALSAAVGRGAPGRIPPLLLPLHLAVAWLPRAAGVFLDSPAAISAVAIAAAIPLHLLAARLLDRAASAAPGQGAFDRSPATT